MKHRNRHIKIAALVLSLICWVSCFAACRPGCEHQESAWIVDTPATYLSAGRQHTQCARCGEILRTETVPQLICDHTQTLWIVDKEASLDGDGSRHLACEICGETLKTEVIPEITLTRDEVVAKLAPSVIKVYCYDSDGVTKITQGSGFFIDEGGAFITNAHVVDGCYFITVQNHLGETYDVDVIYKYNRETSDYAICRAKNCVSTPVTFTEKAAVGNRVYALGYPNDAASLQVTTGEIVSANAVAGTMQLYTNTAVVDHGSSGGVLSDHKGRVLGITTGMFPNGTSATLKYENFKADIDAGFTGGKTPYEYFHSTKK